MTAVQNLSCSQSSLFWESFQTLSDDEFHGRLGAQVSTATGGLLTSFASISRVLDIIESAEDIMFSSDFLLYEDLEPIPIGPNGIQVISATTSTASTFLKPEDTMSEDCHPVISMPTFLDFKNQSIATDSGSLLDSFIHTMKRDADSCHDSSFEEPPLAKKQKTTIMAETTTPGSTTSSVSASAADTMVVTPVSFQQEEEEDITNEAQDGTMEEDEPARFRRYQADQWMERFDDLMNFKAENGHCLVPHSFPPNQQLAQWVKRQRYQYKLKMLGRHSTLTDERQEELQLMGFVWDSHKAAWEERLESLKKYCATNGNCLVPTNYEDDRSLAVWVKCQRRQMKLFRSGRRSTMTQERFEALDRLGFEWNPRNL